MLKKLREAREKKASSLWAGHLYKGTRKQSRDGRKIQGEDLKELLRFEPFSDQARKAMLKVPDAKEDKNGDVLLKHLNIFAGYSDPNKCFNTQNALWDSTGLVRTCDGDTITSEREIYKDVFNHTRSRMVDCIKPCPIADQPLGASCPDECKQEGRLIFYVPELIAGGISLPVEMTVHAWSDLFSIEECLENILVEYGDIRTSPFPCGSFGNLIPLVLRRNLVKVKRPVVENKLRTGKKVDGKAWAIAISVNPIWHQAYIRWQQSIAIEKQIGTGTGESHRLYLEAVTLEVEPESEKPLLPPSLTLKQEPIDNDVKDLMEIAIKRGLKAETAVAIANKVTSPDQFKKLCDQALSIQLSIEKGCDANTARSVMKSVNGDITAFNQWVDSIFPGDDF